MWRKKREVVNCSSSGTRGGDVSRGGGRHGHGHGRGGSSSSGSDVGGMPRREVMRTSTPAHKQISSLITRICARQLNYRVTPFLASCPSYLDNENMCSLLLLRNDGQDQNRDGFVWARFGL
jgi:hypothetical protein